MPSPGAADQHRNQVNRNERGRERETGRRRNIEWEPERERETEREEGQEVRREGILSAADAYQNYSLPYRALIRPTSVQLLHISKEANRKAFLSPLLPPHAPPSSSTIVPLFPRELAVEAGNQGVSSAKKNTSSCQIEDLIEIREKTQNHTFCNHSAGNTFSGTILGRRLAGLSPGSPSTNLCEPCDFATVS